MVHRQEAIMARLMNREESLQLLQALQDSGAAYTAERPRRKGVTAIRVNPAFNFEAEKTLRSVSSSQEKTNGDKAGKI